MSKIKKSILEIIKEEILKNKIFSVWEDYTQTSVYKNPPSIKNFPNLARGITTPNGDLYILDENNDIFHADILDYLTKHEGYSLNIKETRFWSTDMNKKFISWQKKENNILCLGESTMMSHFDKFYDGNVNGFMDYIDSLTIKHPNIKFVLEKIYLYRP